MKIRSETLNTMRLLQQADDWVSTVQFAQITGRRRQNALRRLQFLERNGLADSILADAVYHHPQHLYRISDEGAALIAELTAPKKKRKATPKISHIPNSVFNLAATL